MPPPPAQRILYTFAPPTDSFDGTYEADYAPYSYNEITGTYTIRGWADTYYFGYNQTPVEAYLYKAHASSGRINRIKFTWSTTQLPNVGSGHLMLAALGFSNTLEGNPESILWGKDVVIVVDDEGHLWSYYWGGASSTNAIVANTDYEFEIYIYNDWSEIVYPVSNAKWQIWVDGDLWLADQVADPFYYLRSYVQLYIGWQGTGSGGNGYPDWWPKPFPFTAYDHHVHYTDIVWTIEELGGPRWTMMAPGIA